MIHDNALYVLVACLLIVGSSVTVIEANSFLKHGKFETWDQLVADNPITMEGNGTK